MATFAELYRKMKSANAQNAQNTTTNQNAKSQSQPATFSALYKSGAIKQVREKEAIAAANTKAAEQNLQKRIASTTLPPVSDFVRTTAKQPAPVKSSKPSVIDVIKAIPKALTQGSLQDKVAQSAGIQTSGEYMKSLSPSEQEYYKKHPVAKAIVSNPIARLVDKAAAVNDVAGAKMRQTVFGDNTPYENGNAPTTGNKTLDAVANVAGTLESAFIPSGDAELPANVIRGAAEGFVNKAAAKTGSKILAKEAAKKAATGAVESIPYTAQQIATQKMTPAEAAKTAVINTALGGVIEPAIMGAGALAKKIKGSVSKGGKAAETVAEETPKPVAKAEEIKPQPETVKPVSDTPRTEPVGNMANATANVTSTPTVENLKKIRMGMKEGSTEYNNISKVIGKMEGKEKPIAETVPASAPEKADNGITPTVAKTDSMGVQEGLLDNTQKQDNNIYGGDISGGNQRAAEAEIAGEPDQIRAEANRQVESGRVYRRRDSGVAEGLRVNGKEIPSTEYVPDVTVQKSLSENGKDLSVIHNISDSDAFHAAIGAAKKENPHGAYVTQHTSEEYSNANKFLTKDGHSGVAVMSDGDIVSVFNNGKKSNIRNGSTQLLLTALENGGKKLDNFGGKLSDIYEQHGFIPVAKTKFDREFAPENWNYERDGEPDIIFYAHNGDKPAEVARKTGEYDFYDKSKIPEFSTYDEAAAYRDKVLADMENKKGGGNGSAVGKVPTTEEEHTFVNQAKADMPDDEEGLKQVISNLESQSKTEKDEHKLLNINLQLFAANEKLQEISKFRTNTLRKTPDLAGAEMQKVVDDIDMSYGVKTHPETIRRAQNMVNSNMQGVMDRIQKNGLEGAEDTAAAYFIEHQLKEEAKKTGDYAKLKSWLKKVQVSGTKHGQTIEAFKLWQQDPDNMFRNATKVVDDAEDKVKKTNPEKIKQIDKETKETMDAVDQVDKEAADEIKDEVNKKAVEFVQKRKQRSVKAGEEGESPAAKGGTEGKTPSENSSVGGGKPAKDRAKGKPLPEKEQPKPEDILASKVQSYVKDPKTPKDDPVMDMVNELFRVAKESPITREKVKSKTALEFISEAIHDRQHYATTWIKAKQIVRERLKDNPDALAKLDKYFDKGIRPPFSDKNFSKAISEGMKDLDVDIGEMVRNYYAVGSKQRKELADYLVEKSGLEADDAKALAKYVQNRMKELTKAKKEQILKNIFKDAKAAAKEKPGAIKSLEELSNAGAFVNNNYKDRVMEKLSPRLQKLINEKFKGSPTKANGVASISDRIDFGELVRKSTSEVDFTRTKFLKEISEKLQVNDEDARGILKAVESRFNEIVDEKRASILGNMFKKREATVKKTGIQRVQEYINKQMELENLGAQEDSIRDFIKEKYGLPTLTNDDMAFITDHIDKLKNLQEGTRPYNETLWRIYNRIESKVPSGFIDKFRAWQRISMLPNAKTFLRNILGNVFMEKMENFNELTTESLVDWIVSGVTGKRTVLGPSALLDKSVAQAKGKIKGLADTITDIRHGVDTYEVAGQYEINRAKNAFKNPALNWIEEFTNKTLQFGDRQFYEAAKARRIAELKRIYKTAGVTDEMEADAMLYALDRTFQNDSKLATGVQRMKNAIDDPTYKAIANIIVPFAKTPANVLDKISDYTPIGLVKALGHLGKTAGKGTFDQHYFSQRLGRMLTGSGAIALGYVLAQKGIITGKPTPTTNNNKKGNFDKETGKQGYSLKLGDQYIAYDWSQPVGALMAMGADAYGQGMSKGDLGKAIEGGGNTFFNMSMLQSLNSLFSYGNPMGGFISTMLGGTQQFTPTGAKQAAKIFDKYERDTSGDGILESTLNKFKSGIPVVRNTLPVKTDSFGNSVEVQEGYGPLQKVLNIAVNPANTTKENMNDYEKEMDRLYNLDWGKEKKPDVLPSVLDRKIKDDKTGIEYDLTPEQYNKYKKYYGELAVDDTKDEQGNVVKRGIESLINSGDYQKFPDKLRAKRISILLSNARKAAERKMLSELKNQ